MITLLLVPILIGLLLLAYYRSVKRPYNYPPGPQFLPWLGNSIQYRKEALAAGGQHILFDEWAKRYNTNILGLKLGQDFVVVVLNYPLVREVQLQEVFEGRPDNFFLRLRTMGTRKGITCTDGKLWYEHRNFAMKQMRHVGYGRTQMEKHIKNEVISLMAFIKSTKESSIYPGTFLAQSVLNVLWCLIAGKRIEHSDNTLKKLLDLMNRRSKLFDMCGGLLTQFPWLRFVAPEKTGYNLIRQLNNELLNFFMEAIQEHKRRLELDQNCNNDLIFAYLREMQQAKNDANENTTFNETQLVMTILDFFIAGSQTTSNTINIAIMMLAIKENIQNQLYKEIHANLIFSSDDDEFSHFRDRGAYPHTAAFIMEIQRYFHIIPIIGPRRALWDTTLGGYNIPKNTTILSSIRSVHLDETHWNEPNEFKPERFLDGEGKLIKDEYLIPFGMGRRRCLGDALARICIFSFLIMIIQHFYIVPNEGEMPSMILQPGITLSPKPYNVKFISR